MFGAMVGCVVCEGYVFFIKKRTSTKVMKPTAELVSTHDRLNKSFSRSFITID